MKKPLNVRDEQWWRFMRPQFMMHTLLQVLNTRQYHIPANRFSQNKDLGKTCHGSVGALVLWSSTRIAPSFALMASYSPWVNSPPGALMRALAAATSGPKSSSGTTIKLLTLSPSTVVRWSAHRPHCPSCTRQTRILLSSHGQTHNGERVALTATASSHPNIELCRSM